MCGKIEQRELTGRESNLELLVMLSCTFVNLFAMWHCRQQKAVRVDVVPA